MVEPLAPCSYAVKVAQGSVLRPSEVSSLVDLFLVVFGIATTAASCQESCLSARVGSGRGFRFPDCAICLLYLVLGSQRLLVWIFELGETCVPLS